MTYLYHTFNEQECEQIRLSGLTGLDWVQKHDEWGLPLSPRAANQSQHRPLPDPGPPTRTLDVSPDAPRSIGRAIVEAVFEDERPANLSSRNPAVFFYCDRERAGPNWANECVAIVDPTRISSPLIAADATPKTTIMNQAISTVRGEEDATVTEADVRAAAQEYWATAGEWTAETDYTSSIEVYTPAPVAETAISDVTSDLPEA